MVYKPSLPKENRIYVNRSLNFGAIQLIGFDMDHTLAPYIRETFENLAFRKTIEKFVEAGYPQALLALEFKPNFLIRGLLVDHRNGNLLKVDGHKYVKRAYHGYRELTKEERHELYNNRSFKAQEFFSLDSFFALSEVQLFVEIVEFMSKHPGEIKKSFVEIYQDLRIFIDLCHQDGSIKSEVLKDPGRYIIRDKFLSTTLIRLLDAKKELFLLTNSRFDYTNEIMSYILHGAHESFSSWKSYWNMIVVGAGKPTFFTGTQPFFEVVEASNLLKIHDGPLAAGRIYHGGNAALFEKLTGYRGDEILYVGDHIYGDIIHSKGSLNWRTLLIVEELEVEMEKLESCAGALEEIYEWIRQKEQLDEELQRLRSWMAANERHHVITKEKENERLLADFEGRKQSLKLLEAKIKIGIEKREACFHPVWGELMKVGLERSRFANQLDSYGCLYTSRVSNLRFYSPYKVFLAFKEQLPHEIL
jgi:5'-nucleotidase